MIYKICIGVLTCFSLSSCTQIVTVPVSIAGTVVGTTIDVTGAAVGAVVRSDDEKEEKD